MRVFSVSLLLVVWDDIQYEVGKTPTTKIYTLERIMSLFTDFHQLMITREKYKTKKNIHKNHNNFHHFSFDWQVFFEPKQQQQKTMHYNEKCVCFVFVVFGLEFLVESKQCNELGV